MIGIGHEQHSFAGGLLVPDDLAIEPYVSAPKRGVNIEIIVPGPEMHRGKLGKMLDESRER
jgi:hypothetical protein